MTSGQAYLSAVDRYQEAWHEMTDLRAHLEAAEAVDPRTVSQKKAERFAWLVERVENLHAEVDRLMPDVDDFPRYEVETQELEDRGRYADRLWGKPEPSFLGGRTGAGDALYP